MGVFDEYQSASFRGVPFLVPNENEDIAQKSATHDYVNSDKRDVEQFGKIPPVFKMEGVMHGDDAIQQRIRLRAALLVQGLGELVHPIYGAIQVKAMPASVRSSQTEMGVFKFSLEFAVSNDNVTPTPTTANEHTVTQSFLDVSDALNVALEANFVEPDKGSLLEVSANKTIDVALDVQTKINTTNNVESSGSSTFNRVADALQANAFKEAQQPSTMAESMGLLFSSALEVTGSPSQLTGAWTGLLDFGLGSNGATSDFDPVNTVSRLLKATNSNLLDEYTRLIVLASLYEAIAYTDFETVNDLTKSQELLDDRYNAYLEDAISLTEDAGLISIATDSTVSLTFATLRNIAREAMNTKAQNLFRVVDISPRRSSMVLTAYQYYGNLDTLDLLESLNDSVNVSGFNEDTISAVSK